MNLKSSVFNLKESLARSLTSHVVAGRSRLEKTNLTRVGTTVSPILARRCNSLRLPELRDSTSELITSLFASAGIDSWVLPSEYHKSNVIGVDVRNAERLLQALKKELTLQTWYVRKIASNGKSLAAVSRVRDRRIRASWSGFELFEVVAHDSHSSFMSDSTQGIQVHFWDVSTAKNEIASRVWNPRVMELPDPRLDRASFDKALEAATKPLIDEPYFPIDAVYTWVDGTDENWQRLKAKVQSQHTGEALIQDALANARFDDHDELRYSLRSIEQYAPWIRKVWIVTSGQVPDWLELENPKVQIVTHDDIWPSSEGLPNFNSHAIEACLHRIEGLAEHYLYFNDDMILGKPVSPSNFFHGNGVSKYFYSRALVGFGAVNADDNASTIAAKNAREALNLQTVSTLSRKFFHTPSPLRRSVTEQLEAEYPELFVQTRKAQFRESTDIAVAGSFYFNVAGAMGFAVPGRIKYEYIDPAIEEGRQRMLRVIRQRDRDSICVNDGSTDETEVERIETDQFIRSSLEEFLPVPSRFEKFDQPAH